MNIKQYTNFIGDYYQNGCRRQGEYIEPGQRMTLNEALDLLHHDKECPEDRSDYDDEEDYDEILYIRCAFVIWYRKHHIIVRPSEQKNNYYHFLISRDRIENNKEGYFPTWENLWPTAHKKYLQRLINKHIEQGKVYCMREIEYAMEKLH